MVDVSDGESFLWVGKTTHKLQCFKPNVSSLSFYNFSIGKLYAVFKSTNLDLSGYKITKRTYY